jgi:pimeloyl-ACP methyl ester carboxylesterase
MQTTSALETGDYIEVDGMRTHYHEAGAGDAVVLIHGSGPGVTAWANWRNTLPLLAQHFHVLAPDLLGFGYSARPEGAPYGREYWVDHLIAFMRAKNVSRCHLIGNSLGGALTLAIAASKPDLVNRLVLMGAAGVPFAVTPGLEAVWGYEPSVAAMHDLIANHFAYDPALATEGLVHLRYAASVQTGFHESYHAMFPAPYQRHLNALATPDEAIAKIESPTLLLHGREDRVVPLAVSLRLFELLPNAELHAFGKCGHWTMIERATDFNRLVMQFLRDSVSA